MIVKFILTLSRILVGSLFIVSGLIKSNDAMGFKYKLEEYFEPGALNMSLFEPIALELAIFVCVAEVLLGIAILTGAKAKLTAVLSLLMMLFFTWLTYYTHTCDPTGVTMITDAAGEAKEIVNQCVLECGCFGNAIPLTPWESFLKDLTILIFVIPIVIGAFANKIKLNTVREDIIVYTAAIVITALFGMLMLDWLFPVIFLVINLFVVTFLKKRLSDKWREWGMAIGILVVCSIFQHHTLAHLPMKDYRPYAVGKNIGTQMKSVDELNEALLAQMSTGNIDNVYAFINQLDLPNADSLHFVKKYFDTYQTMNEGQREENGLALMEDLGTKISLTSPVYATKFVFKNIKTGADTLVLSSDWLRVYSTPWFKSTYENVTYDGDEVMLEEGYEPAIKDFSLETYEGDNITQEVLGFNGYTFLQISNDLSKTNESAQAIFNSLAKESEASGNHFYAVTNALYEETEAYRHKHGAAYPFLNCDQIELKIIVRSNPGLVLLKDGTVVQKWAWRDVPKWAEVSKEYMK
jgi:uncharacterized membrane protein YphA (DoxX/SURF4 family)